MTHTQEWYDSWKMPDLVNGMNERDYIKIIQR